MRKLIIATMLGLAIAIPLVAQGDDRATNQETKKVLDGVLEFVVFHDDQPMAIDDRKRFAEAIRSYCKYYRDLVPTLSPSEHEWLNRELGTASTVEINNRTIAALDSVEHSRAVLTKVYDGCIAIAEHLTRSDENSHSVHLWSGLAYQLIYHDPSRDLANVRERYGAITEPEVSLSDHNQRSIAATILSRIVMNDTRQ